MTEKELKALKTGSARIRMDTLKMLQRKGYGHLGGAMSIVELLSVLYNRVLRYKADQPDWPERDYVILSKGHAGPAWYAALALPGFFDMQWLETLNDGGTNLPSHPDRLKTPGVDSTTGSLGQGTSVAAGLGLAIRAEKSDQKVYLIVGDGELNEGQCWEAFQLIAHHRLHEVIVIIDNNKRQLDGKLTDIINPQDIAEKMKAFGFTVLRANGRDEGSICEALEAEGQVRDSAVCVLMDTIKAQGMPYYENRDDSHSPRFDEAANKALDEVITDLQKMIEGEGESCSH